jgi:putative NADH-flavin reductase
MKIAVFGATGKTGRAVIEEALSAGHSVTAFARQADRITPADGLNVIDGDALELAQVAPALKGQDAVVISLGNSQNAFALLFGARRTTPKNVCEVGTRNILAALPSERDIPVIVVGAFGTGDTAADLPFMFKLFYRLILREQMADKEKQDIVLKASAAAYTLIQPLALTDKPATGTWTTSRDGSYGKSEVSRGDLAAFIVQRLANTPDGRETITFSG